MNIVIEPGPLRGTVNAIPSKSHAHRLMIAAALTGGGISVPLGEPSADLLATRDCLARLGDDAPVLPCRESGSTLRFLLPVALALRDRAEFLGEGRLLSRPLSPLREEMESHGCRFETAKGKLRVRGRLQPGLFRLAGDVSSQFVTGLLFALPLLDGDSRIEVTTPLESAGYVDLTLEVLKAAGIRVEAAEENGLPCYVIPGSQRYALPDGLAPEGDWSNGAVWLAANHVGFQSQVRVAGLPEASLQGDRAIAALLRDFPARIDASQVPDLVPVLDVVAALRPGVTVIDGASRLRLKESDRIATTAALIQSLDDQAEETEDGLVLRGRPLLEGGEVSGAGDHRIVMAAALAATACKKPVTILGAEAVQKSYPGFFRDYRALGGNIHEI